MQWQYLLSFSILLYYFVEWSLLMRSGAGTH